MNPAQPDIAAAIVLFGISTWLKNNYDHLVIDHRRHCARSLSELARDYPYLNRKGIEKIIHRAEANGFLIVRRGRKKLHFTLPKHAAEICAKRHGRIWFKIGDAELYGEKAAIILANLQWQQENSLPHVTDAKGVRFYPLGSAMLSQYLPMSRWTIARQMERLTKGTPQALILHHSQVHHYARVEEIPGFKTPTSARAEVECSVAERDCDVAEGDNIQKGDSNIDCNKDEKWFQSTDLGEAAPSPEPLITSSSFPDQQQADWLEDHQGRSFGTYASSPAAKITIVTDDDEQEVDMVNIPLQGLDRADYLNSILEQEMALDIVPSLQRLQDHIDDETEQIIEAFRRNRMECTQEDEKIIRQFFLDNPQLTARHLTPLLASCRMLRDGIPSRGISLGARYLKVDESSCLTFPKRVDSAKYFFHRLPEIIAQLSGGFDEADEELQQINFLYLGEERINGVVQLYRGGEKVEKESTEFNCCPV